MMVDCIATHGYDPAYHSLPSFLRKWSRVISYTVAHSSMTVIASTHNTIPEALFVKCFGYMQKCTWGLNEVYRKNSAVWQWCLDSNMMSERDCRIPWWDMPLQYHYSRQSLSDGTIQCYWWWMIERGDTRLTLFATWESHFNEAPSPGREVWSHLWYITHTIWITMLTSRSCISLLETREEHPNESGLPGWAFPHITLL